MATRKRVTVQQWIERALADSDKGAPCSALSLVFLKGIAQEEIHTKELTGPQSAPQLSEFFIDRACGFAQDLAGIQTFKMLAFYGKAEPQAAFPFTVADGELTAGDNTSYSKHEATPTGMLGQLMKHNENIMSLNVQLVMGMASEGMQLRKDLSEATMLVRDAVMQMTVQGNEQQMKVLQFQRETKERTMFAEALPALVNHLTGREIVPDEFALGKVLEGMAGRIGAQDLQMLVGMGKLTSQEAQILAARFAKIKDDQTKAAALLKTAPNEEQSLETNGKALS